MHDIRYVTLESTNANQLLDILNDPAVRNHLIAHDTFNEQTLTQWLIEKQTIDSQHHFLVRTVLVDDTLAGWCGIQPDINGAELAIVLTPTHWGVGPRVFKQLINWANQLGHDEAVIHLLESRKPYPFIRRRAMRYQQSTLLGHRFNTYFFST